MSFSTIVKENIISGEWKSKCCKKAFVYGVLMGAEVSDNILRVTMSDTASIDFTRNMLVDIFKVKHIETASFKRGAVSFTTMSLSLPTASKLLSDIENGADPNISLKDIFVCKNCALRFLAGLFCACGTVGHPHKSRSAEILFHNKARAESAKSVFDNHTDATAGLCKKGNKYSIYFSTGDSVMGLLSLFCTKKFLFDVLYMQIENEARRTAQREANCMAKNIQKSTSASSVHQQAIQNLIDRDKFYLLSDELAITARLRIDNPELSLGALAQIHNPPITKSGLNHRLEKIIKISQELTEETAED